MTSAAMPTEAVAAASPASAVRRGRVAWAVVFVLLLVAPFVGV